MIEATQGYMVTLPQLVLLLYKVYKNTQPFP